MSVFYRGLDILDLLPQQKRKQRRVRSAWPTHPVSTSCNLDSTPPTESPTARSNNRTALNPAPSKSFQGLVVLFTHRSFFTSKLNSIFFIRHSLSPLTHSYGPPIKRLSITLPSNSQSTAAVYPGYYHEGHWAGPTSHHFQEEMFLINIRGHNLPSSLDKVTKNLKANWWNLIFSFHTKHCLTCK